MATQVIGHQRATATTHGMNVGWNSVRDFFTSICKLAGVYFASPWILDVSGPQYRANLSVNGRVEMETNLWGIAPF